MKKIASPRTLRLAGAAALIAFVLVVPVAGQDAEVAPESFERAMLFGRMAERLDLSEAQEDQVRALFADQRDQMQTDRDRLRTAHEGMRERIHALEPSETAIRDAAAAVADVQADMAVARAGLLQEIRTVLDDEQQATLQAMLDEEPPTPRRHAGRGGPGGFEEHRQRGRRP